MRNTLPAAIAGLLFGAGLVISGMSDPQRVLAFLRLAPGWDPSLAFVMVGALAVTLPGFAALRRRGHPFFSERFSEPATHRVDRELILGAGLFGLGWGWAGYCPGPALVGAGLGHWSAVIFVTSMLTGAWLIGRLQRMGATSRT